MHTLKNKVEFVLSSNNAAHRSSQRAHQTMSFKTSNAIENCY